MSEPRIRAPLRRQTLMRPDDLRMEPALARNNSWSLVVPAGAEGHADRYDTRV